MAKSNGHVCDLSCLGGCRLEADGAAATNDGTAAASAHAPGRR